MKVEGALINFKSWVSTGQNRQESMNTKLKEKNMYVLKTDIEWPSSFAVWPATNGFYIYCN